MPHLLVQLRVRALCGVGALCSPQVGLRLVLSDRSSASTSTGLLFTLSPVLPWASPVSISTAAAPLRAFGIFHFCFCNNSFTEI